MTIRDDPRAPLDFDIREFTKTAQGNWRPDLDLSGFADAPLDTDTLRLLRHLGRLESATMENLRNLLVTATHKDTRVTAFLVTWAFEKFWLADALDAVLEAHDEPRNRDLPEGPPRHAASEAVARRGPITRALQAITIGSPIVAVHTTTGLVDEWVLRAAYDRLDELGDNPTLRTVIERVRAVKVRHEQFFASEADWRLRDSGRSVKLTRASLLTAVWPIGAVERADSERTYFDTTVFGAAEGHVRADRVGALVADLPGMDATVGSAVIRKLTA